MPGPEAKNAPDQGVGHGNTFRKISVQMPWRANCFASYGGNVSDLVPPAVAKALKEKYR